MPGPLLLTTALCGLGIVLAAFVLTWAAEAAERDISGPLAIAVLSVVALLPEYAVDMNFAFTAGHVPAYAAYAAANMTGSNRLLIGLGWSLVVLLVWFRSRARVVRLAKQHRVEIGFLGIASLYSLTIPLKHSISLFDTAVLLVLFVIYIWLIARGPSEEVELIGPAAWIASLPRLLRRTVLAVLFLGAAGLILVCADPFAHGLVEAGTSLGIDRFLLVQWVAPLASESPEIIAVVLLCLRGRPGSGLAVLLASALNQWTLLVGGLPLAFSLGGHAPGALPLDARQVQEFLLTSALSIVGIVALLDLSIGLWEAILLLAVFVAGVVVQPPALRVALTLGCFAYAAIRVWTQRGAFREWHTAIVEARRARVRAGTAVNREG